MIIHLASDNTSTNPTKLPSYRFLDSILHNISVVVAADNLFMSCLIWQFSYTQPVYGSKFIQIHTLDQQPADFFS